MESCSPPGELAGVSLLSRSTSCWRVWARPGVSVSWVSRQSSASSLPPGSSANDQDRRVGPSSNGESRDTVYPKACSCHSDRRERLVADPQADLPRLAVHDHLGRFCPSHLPPARPSLLFTDVRPVNGLVILRLGRLGVRFQPGISLRANLFRSAVRHHWTSQQPNLGDGDQRDRDVAHLASELGDWDLDRLRHSGRDECR